MFSALKLFEFDGLPSQFGLDLLGLKLENVNDLVKEFSWLKQLSSSSQFVFLTSFHVEQSLDQIKQHAKLAFDESDVP